MQCLSFEGDPELRHLPRARQSGKKLLGCLPVFFGANGISVSSQRRRAVDAATLRN
jgi:hypothetical protein